MATLVRERPETSAAPIDPRIAARREEVARGQGRRRTRQLAAVAIVATVLAAAYGISRSALFDVDRIEVQGAFRTEEAAVVHASGVAVGDQLLDVDSDRAVAAIEQLPWVDRASVTRTWRAGDVSIRIEERQAVAELPAGPEGPDQVAVVDRTGRVLEVRPRGESSLTMLEGVAPAPPGAQIDPAAGPALEIAATLTPGLRSRIAAVVVDGDTYGLALRPNGRVRLGRAEDLGEKLRSLQTLLANIDLAGLCTIDLRVADSPVVDRRQPCA